MRQLTRSLAALVAVCTTCFAQPSSPSNALDALRAAAEESGSDAVLVLHRGDTLAEWYFGKEPKPVEVMSVLKSIVAIGIGRLVTTGAIESLDQPVSTWYPEWRQGQKRDITLRHLLNHTSGLQNVPNAGAEIYPAPDAIQLALAAELTDEPGTVFRYNNKATNLLAGIIQRASGKRMDVFFADEFFGRMGIEEYTWYFDASGNPHAMAGLQLHARDLAKFGLLVLDHGTYQGERLIDPAFIDEMLAQSQPHYPRYGLLWWRLPAITRYVLDEAQLEALIGDRLSTDQAARLRPLIGRVFTDRQTADAAVAAQLGDDWRSVINPDDPDSGAIDLVRREDSEFHAFYADGYLGQTLMVVPDRGIVAVRQVANSATYDPDTDLFLAFKELVLQLDAE